MKSNGLCDPIQSDLNTLTIAESLCPNGVCGNVIQSIDAKVESADDARASCSQSEKNSIIYSKLSRCDYYDASHADCSKYINEELKRMCGGSYNCIVTDNYHYAAWSTYNNDTAKLVILCLRNHSSVKH